MLKLLPKLPEVRTKLDILTMNFLITHKLKNVGGPLLWEALGRGLLGLCLKMALNTALNQDLRVKHVVTQKNR